MQDKKVKLCGLTVFKCKTKGKKQKFYILGMPMVKKVTRDYYTTYRLFGFKLFRCKAEMQYEPKKYQVNPNSDTKEVLVVNTDSIGDYILFRNFLKMIKLSEKYKDYKLVFLGCEKFKEFAEYLDSDIVDEFIWCPPRPESRESDEIRNICINLKNQGLKNYYDTIIFASVNSMPKRKIHNKLLEDTYSKERIIFMDSVHSENDCTKMLDYTYIYLNHNTKEMFEFESNKVFWEEILELKINLNHALIESDKIILQDEFKQRNKYVIINPCAFNSYRMWHIHNWGQIIRWLKDKNYDVILVCSENEKAYCDKLAEESQTEVEVLAGLPVERLLALLKQSQLYIGQDSGIFHVAAATDAKALCISAGNAYFRFMNYPKDRDYVKILFPETVEDWILKNKDLYPAMVREIGKFYINTISVNRVKKAINDLLELPGCKN